MQTISLDYLQFTVEGKLQLLSSDEETQLAPNIFLKMLPFGDKHFIHSGLIIYHGLEFAKISFLPRNDKVMSPDTIIFKILNQNLYSKGFIKTSRDIWKQLNLTFKHVSKMDICIDTTEASAMNVINDFLKGKLTKKGRGQLHTTFEGRKSDALIYWRIGQGISNKLMRGYYKKAEAEKLGKFYILDFWRNNGWKESEESVVERIEVSLKKEAIDEVIHDNLMKRSNFLEKLEDFNYLYKLFSSQTNGFFEFVKTKELQSKKVYSRCKKIGIELFTKKCELINKIKCFTRTEVKRIKIAAKTLFAITKKTGNLMYSAIAREMTENIDHVLWFDKSFDRWNYEIKKGLFFGRFTYESKYITYRQLQQLNLFLKPVY